MHDYIDVVDLSDACFAAAKYLCKNKNNVYPWNLEIGSCVFVFQLGHASEHYINAEISL